MQITEIRWADGHQENFAQRYRLPVGRGITLVDGRGGQGKEALFSHLQTGLVMEPGRFAGLGETGIIRYWQFIFEEKDRRFTYSTDQTVEGREAFFRRSIIGKEGEILGPSLDYAFLADGSRTSDEKRLLISQLLTRLEYSRSQAYDPLEERGRLVLLRQDLSECEEEIGRLGRQAGSPESGADLLSDGENRLAALKAEDSRLAREQQKQKYLATKDEYEKLIRLEEEMEDTKEREGAFGSRITDLGHNITVHELTELARMRSQVQEEEVEAGEMAEALEATRRERKLAEQQRALLRRRLNELEAEKTGLPEARGQLGPPPQSAREEDRDKGAFPSPGQLLWLTVLLVFAAGLFLTLYIQLIGLLVSGVALLAAAGIGLYQLFDHRRAGLDPPVLPGEPSDGIFDESAHYQLEAQRSESRGELDLIMSRIAELDQKEADLSTAYESKGRRFRRAENELLRKIRQYAGPSEIAEVDAIIETLSRQRDSSAYYNETIADFTRRIAELKHGRSKQEMKREYDRACARLYGDPANPSPLDGGFALEELVFEPERLQEIAAERVELAGRIDALAEEIDGQRKRLNLSREAKLALGSLEQRQRVLWQSLQDTRDEYERAGTAAAWLEELLSSWDDLDCGAWMEESAGYLYRLTGRRPGGIGVGGEADRKGGRIRTPRLPGGQTGRRKADAVDLTLFKAAPPPVCYLASRLALSLLDARGEERGEPIFLIEPGLIAGTSQREHLLNALEEWTLETGRQAVYFTEDEALIFLAQARKMNIYHMT